MAEHTTSDSLLSFRDRFPITKRSNYLINNSLGAMPVATRDRLAQYLDEWDSRGVRSWGDGWWILQEQVADQIAGVLGVDAGTVSMHQNIAVALEMILSCFRFDGERNAIASMKRAAHGSTCSASPWLRRSYQRAWPRLPWRLQRLRAQSRPRWR